MVLLASHVEAYLVNVLVEATDTFTDWNNLSEGAQHYVAARTRQDLEAFLASTNAGQLTGSDARRRLIDAVRVASGRLDQPGQHKWIEPVDGFYGTQSFKAVSRRLERMHPTAYPLERWVHDRKQDVSRIRTVLDELIEIRNSVAHRGLARAPLYSDLRIYLAACCFFVRDVEAYMVPMLTSAPSATANDIWPC